MIFAVLGQIQFGVIRMTAPVLLAFVGTPVAVAWILQAGLPRKLVTVASILLVIYAVSLVWSDAEGWESEAGFAFGYAAISLMISAFMRPTIRGAGIPLVAASTAGWLVLSILFAGALALEGPDGGGSDLLGEVIIGVGELLIMLRDVEGLSTSEAGAGLGLGDEAVKTRLHRARAMIRRALTARLGSAAEGAFAFEAPRCDRVVAGVLARLPDA